ncbi:LysR substrate-binding domain-containing protein [Nonomuraea sp. NPDC050536]|uniref:LysR family transcriptional regulator n=1 Tax=Nonomuraea sp. NPDC050536 TaxID=3364366 RepID=UPI0037CC8121
MTYEYQVTAKLAPALALLAAVGETGHVTRAAELLGIPQPTASRRLAALAEVVGAPLVLPDGRGVRLTRAGKALADSASRAMSVVAGGVREVREEIDPGSGRVVLGFLHLLGRALVPSLIRGFRERNPGVRFTLVQGSRQDMLERLRDGELDLVLVAPPPDDDLALAAAPLAEQELRLSVPRGHRLATRDRVRLADLEGEDLVTLEHGYGLRQIIDDLCAEAGFEPRIAFESQESETVRGLVAAGFGVALLPHVGAVRSPGVVDVPLEPPVYRQIGLSWPAADRLTPVVRSFRDHVLRTVGGDRQTRVS